MNPLHSDQPKHRKPPQSVQLLATIALILIGGICSAAIAYQSIVKMDDASTTLLGTLATAALGALVVLAGGRSKE
jgi:hypothetical protein